MPERPLKILLVEDHRETADITAHLLRRYGHEVDIARNGTAAMEALQAPLPDVVLLDIGLPGIDGWQIAKRVTDNWSGGNDKRPLLVAITGYGQEQDRVRSQQAGIDLHLTKPVDPRQLKSLLSRFHRIVAE